jgi:flagellin-like protein
MKGLSELISSVLLLVLTITIAVIIFTFYQSNVTTTTEKVGNKSGEAIDCTSGNINIEDVFITNGTTGSVRVIVRNAGFTTLDINSAQVYNRTGSNFSSSMIPLTNFEKGSIATLVFENVSIEACPLQFSKAIVTTSCGGVSDTFDGTPNCV